MTSSSFPLCAGFVYQWPQHLFSPPGDPAPRHLYRGARVHRGGPSANLAHAPYSAGAGARRRECRTCDQASLVSANRQGSIVGQMPLASVSRASSAGVALRRRGASRRPSMASASPTVDRRMAQTKGPVFAPDSNPDLGRQVVGEPVKGQLTVAAVMPAALHPASRAMPRLSSSASAWLRWATSMI